MAFGRYLQFWYLDPEAPQLVHSSMYTGFDEQLAVSHLVKDKC